MTNYAIDSGDGNQLTCGLSAHTAHRTAQRMADEIGESVFLYAEQDPDGTDDDGCCVACGHPADGSSGHGTCDEGAHGPGESEEIEPTEIEIDMHSPNGPVVEYGGHDAHSVEVKLPPYCKVDWSNAVEISVSGTHTLRYRAPIVNDQPARDHADA